MKSLSTGVFAAVLAVGSVGAFAVPAAASAASLDWSRTATGYYGGQITVNGSCTSGEGCDRTKTNVGVYGTNATRTKTTSVGGGEGYTHTVNTAGAHWSFTRIFSWV